MCTWWKGLKWETSALAGKFEIQFDYKLTFDKHYFVFVQKKNDVFHWRSLQEMWPYPQETADLVILTEEILNGILHFLCAVAFMQKQSQIINTLDRIAW